MYNKKGLSEEQWKLLLQHKPDSIGIWYIPIYLVLWFIFNIVCAVFIRVDEIIGFWFFLAPTALSILVILVNSHWRPDKAIKKWWYDNVRGNIAEFWIDIDGDLEMTLHDRVSYKVRLRQEPDNVYFVALGGWFLWTSNVVRGSYLEIQRYKKSVYEWLGEGEPDPLYVYLTDITCSRIRLSLVNALNFMAASKKWCPMWPNGLEYLLDRSDQREILAAGVNEAIDKALSSARHRQSKSVSDLRRLLEGVLKDGAAELVHDRTVLNVPLSQAATSGMAIVET